MPELPEVQSVVNGLNEKILNKTICKLTEFRNDTIEWYIDIKHLTGKITSILRRGKFIIINTDSSFKLIVHLGMTGKLVYNQQKDSKHIRAQVEFQDKTLLYFDDIRTFGRFVVMSKDKTLKSIDTLGVEPFDRNFNEKYLHEKLKNKTIPIKNAIMDQKIIAGIGNIYASEILFRAGINPTTPSNKLKNNQINKIIEYTKMILSEAIKCNGTTISDFRSVEDKTGEFQNFLQVYQKDLCKCGSAIKKIKQSGRSTFYCPVCQK